MDDGTRLHSASKLCPSTSPADLVTWTCDHFMLDQCREGYQAAETRV